MPDIPRHSHPRRSIYVPGGRYFVTTVVQGRAPLNMNVAGILNPRFKIMGAGIENPCYKIMEQGCALLLQGEESLPQRKIIKGITLWRRLIASQRRSAPPRTKRRCALLLQGEESLPQRKIN